MSCIKFLDLKGVKRFFSKVARALWGEITPNEYKKFGILSAALFCIIGSYWMVRTMKNAIFCKVVGSMYLPYAKIVSLIFMILLVLFYGKLVDWFKRHRLIYIMATTYGCLYLLITLMMLHPTIGLANTVPSKYRLFGWITYLVIESFGSLVVALFWSFVASSMDSAAAKKGFPVILFGAQFGSVLGNILNLQLASRIGLPILFFIASLGVFLVPFIIAFFMKIFGPTMPKLPKVEQKSTGPVEGLKLLLTKKYLLGILGVSTLYEVVATVIDFRMNSIANQAYSSAEKLTEFLAIYGLAANVLALLFVFIGTSFLIRRFGLTFCLVTFPVTVGCLVLGTWAYPTLWSLLAAMVVLKGLTYALNNPSKDIMYVPTSKDIKFKAKSWIDCFGSRSAKSVGSGVSAAFPIMANLVVFGSIISLGVVGVWIAIAFFVGNTNKKLVDSGLILE